MPAAQPSNAVPGGGPIRIELLGSGRAPVDAKPEDGRTVSIGRPVADAVPDVPLDAPSVSRKHAEVAFRDGRWRIRNLGKAGTLVDQAPLAEGQSVPLELRFDKAGVVKTTLKVKARVPAGHEGHEHMHKH